MKCEGIRYTILSKLMGWAVSVTTLPSSTVTVLTTVSVGVARTAGGGAAAGPEREDLRLIRFTFTDVYVVITDL